MIEEFLGVLSSGIPVYAKFESEEHKTAIKKTASDIENKHRLEYFEALDPDIQISVIEELKKEK